MKNSDPDFDPDLELIRVMLVIVGPCVLVILIAVLCSIINF